MDVHSAFRKWLFAILYIDRISIFPQSPLQHMSRSEEALRLLMYASITLKLKKCRFFLWVYQSPRTCDCPGQATGSTWNQGVVLAFRYPTTVSQKRSFFGFCNVCSRSVPGLQRLPYRWTCGSRRQSPYSSSLTKRNELLLLRRRRG